MPGWLRLLTPGFNWVGWDNLTPFDVAIRSGNQQVIDLIRDCERPSDG